MTPTPEQLAEARSIVDQWDTGIDELEHIIAAALAAAFERGREEEREAYIAERIRARKTEGATDEHS